MSAFIRTNSKVLCAISWHTDIILGLEELRDSSFCVRSLNHLIFDKATEDHSSQDFFTKILEADNELSGTTADVKAARKVLQIEPGPTGNINETHFHKAVNRVLAYRVIDICQWIKSNNSSLSSTVVPVSPLDESSHGSDWEAGSYH